MSEATVGFVIEGGHRISVEYWWVMGTEVPLCCLKVVLNSLIEDDHFGRVEFRVSHESFHGALDALNKELVRDIENEFLKATPRRGVRTTKKLAGNWICDSGKWEMYDGKEWVQRDPWEKRDG